MNKDALRNAIIARLEADQALLLKAAKDAHAAATHAESAPDNKYDTQGLEASYVAQGQANRAQEIRLALETFRQMPLQTFAADAPIRLSALVQLEADDGSGRLVFLAPASGGLLLEFEQRMVMVITPASPLGRALIGRCCGEVVEVATGTTREYEVVSVR